MNSINLDLYKEPRNNIKTSTLILFAFGVLFFSRLIDVLGAPEIVNFVHFAVIPFVCGFALVNTRTQDRQQISGTWALIGGLLTLLGVMLASAILNGASIVNVVLDYLLLAEPFMMLLAVISIPLSPIRLLQVRKGLMSFAFFNLFLAFFQAFVLSRGNPDLVYGVFFSLAGGSLAAIVSLTFGIYYFLSAKAAPKGLRFFVLFASIWQIFISDTKLVLGSFLAGFMLLSLTKISNRTLVYLIVGGSLIYGFLWGVQNLEFLKDYALWIKPEYYLSLDTEFMRAKTMAFKVIPTYYDSFWNSLLGLGPGHTVGRLGGWMMEKYWDMLEPIGASRPFPAIPSEVVNGALAESKNVAATAMFQPMFSWAGIWGDLGLLGLGAYLLVWGLIWKYFCPGDFSRFLILTTFATGFFPGYLEEPGSMLFTTFLIALCWHERRQAQLQSMAIESTLFSDLNGSALTPSDLNSSDLNQRQGS